MINEAVNRTYGVLPWIERYGFNVLAGIESSSFLMTICTQMYDGIAVDYSGFILIDVRDKNLLSVFPKELFCLVFFVKTILLAVMWAYIPPCFAYFRDSTMAASSIWSNPSPPLFDIVLGINLHENDQSVMLIKDPPIQRMLALCCSRDRTVKVPCPE